MHSMELLGFGVGDIPVPNGGGEHELREPLIPEPGRAVSPVELPSDLFEAVTARLPAREDRDPDGQLFPGVTSDRLRMAIRRACRDAGVPAFGPHSLRHRYISLAHKRGDSWAEIGERVGQRSRLVTADRYSHALVDYRAVNRSDLLERVRAVQTPVQTSDPKIAQ